MSIRFKITFLHLLFLYFSFCSQIIFAQNHETDSTFNLETEDSIQDSTPYAVSDRIFRSARPESEMELRRWVKDLSLTTIISLDDYYDYPEQAYREAAWTKGAGSTWIHHPMHHLKGPTLAQLNEVVYFMTRNPKERILVHCQYGKDRTGFAVAAYRISQEHIPVDQAIQELYDFGHRTLLFFWDSVLYDFAKQY